MYGTRFAAGWRRSRRALRWLPSGIAGALVLAAAIAGGQLVADGVETPPQGHESPVKVVSEFHIAKTFGAGGEAAQESETGGEVCLELQLGAKRGHKGSSG